MAFAVWINGVDYTDRVAQVKRRRQLHAVATGTITLIDLAAGVRPRAFDPVQVTHNGTVVFRGEVARPSLSTVVADTGRLWTISCRDDTNQRTQRVFRTGTEASGQTLKAFLTALVADNLSAVGISLDPSQADGPTLPALVFDYARGNAILNTLSTLTGWLWEVNSDLVLSMWPIGSRAAPTTFSAAIGNIDGGVGWEEENLSYRNGQWLTFGGSQSLERELRFEGDGATRVFGLTNPVAIRPAQVYDELAAAYRHVGEYGVDTLFEWTWDPSYGAYGAVRQLPEAPPGTSHAPLTVGQFIRVPFTAQYPQTIYVANATEQAARGIRDERETRDDIIDYAAAVAYAQALMRQSTQTPQQLTLPTRTTGNDPGEICTVEDVTLDCAGAYLIDSEETTYLPVPDADGAAEVTVQLGLVGGEERLEGWLEWWKNRNQGGGGNGGAAAGAGVTVSPGGTDAAFCMALGTRRDGAILPGIAGAPVRDYIPVPIDSQRVAAGVVTVRCEIRRTEGTGTLTPQLRCVETGGICGSGTAAAPAALTAQTPFTAALVTGRHTYALYLVGSDATTHGIAVGTVEAIGTFTGGGGGSGSSGSAGDAAYVHVQTVPSAAWNINHNLGYYPSVSLVNAASAEVVGTVTHVSINQCLVSFTSLETGSARCL